MTNALDFKQNERHRRLEGQTMFRNCSFVLLIAASALAVSSTTFAQRAGQSTTVRTGTVTAMKSVDLNDGNAVGGALVGGAFGAALTKSSKSNSRRNRNAAIGAVLGGAAAASSTRPGRVYTVTTNEGTAIQIATEQTEIRVDDCVFVEESRGTANIRRAPATACEPAASDVLSDPDIVEELNEEADECAAAKQQLVDAESDAAIERAVTKVKLLCYD
jgi:outer membrane lipoprotein SlyB